MAVHRRRFLTICGLTALSGCSSSDGGGDLPADPPTLSEDEFRQKLGEIGVISVEFVSESRVLVFNDSKQVSSIEKQSDGNTYFTIKRGNKESASTDTYQLTFVESAAEASAAPSDSVRSVNVSELESMEQSQREGELAGLRPDVRNVSQRDSGEYEVQLEIKTEQPTTESNESTAENGTTAEAATLASVLILIARNPEVIVAVLGILRDEGDREDHLVTIAIFLGKLLLPEVMNADQNGTDNEDGQADAAVTIRDLAFDPAVLEIEPETTVEWVNEDEIAHAVTSAEFNGRSAEWELNSELSPESRAQFTFEERGVYHYYCGTHGENTMCGAVLVGDDLQEGTLPCVDTE